MQCKDSSLEIPLKNVVLESKINKRSGFRYVDLTKKGNKMPAFAIPQSTFPWAGGNAWISYALVQEMMCRTPCRVCERHLVKESVF